MKKHKFATAQEALQVAKKAGSLDYAPLAVYAFQGGFCLTSEGGRYHKSSDAYRDVIMALGGSAYAAHRLGKSPCTLDIEDEWLDSRTSHQLFTIYESGDY